MEVKSEESNEFQTYEKRPGMQPLLLDCFEGYSDRLLI